MTAETKRSVTCEIVLEFPTEEHASRVFQAIDSDNEDYVRAVVDGPRLKAVIEASSLKSLLHTLDDFLSCVSVAHKVVSD